MAEVVVVDVRVALVGKVQLNEYYDVGANVSI